MKTRIISGAIGVVLCILIFIFGEMFSWIYAVALAIVNAIMCAEYLTAKKLQKQLPILILTFLFSVSMPLAACTSLWYLPIFIYSFLMFTLLIFIRGKVSVGDITFAYSGTMLITLSMSCFTFMICKSGGWHAFYAALGLVGPWCADTCAYFTGRFLGKHKLSPVISPKKTVEGAIGGGLGAIAGCMLAGLIFQFIVYRNMHVNYLALLCVGVFCAFVSVCGDLVFSAIKRECSIKDYGSIMPGHGGLLDRFDSVLFCVPFVFMLSQTWGLISV